jgi:hypothetical protein
VKKPANKTIFAIKPKHCIERSHEKDDMQSVAFAMVVL